ncbi:hypothetical protein [Nitrosophilus alvini]|uniref:hypothetical protein n=1 Tax=Nitrosophilus alvini TaxID=2714855 RepID=UPI001909AEE1|nr:hypothetical protein [Nitrosophilus alvini]
MGNKKTLFGLLLLFVIFVAILPRPEKEKVVVNEILFAKPLFFRALTGYTHTFTADKLWLLSNTVGETAVGDSFKADENEVYTAFKTIIYMDPYFYPAVSYAATYLASIKNRLDLATDLIKTARMFNPNDFKLYFLEIILILTYEKPDKIDDNYIAELAKKAALLPDSQKILGRILLSEWVEELLIYARNQKGKKEQAIEDLKWLLKNTKNPTKKKEIEKKLKELMSR